MVVVGVLGAGVVAGVGSSNSGGGGGSNSHGCSNNHMRRITVAIIMIAMVKQIIRRPLGGVLDTLVFSCF